MAADERAVLRALIGGNKGRGELLATTELLDIDWPRTPGMLLERGIDQQNRAKQRAAQQKAEQGTSRLELGQLWDKAAQPE